MVGEPLLPNPVSAAEVGAFRSREARKLVTADQDLIDDFRAAKRIPPTFFEAGPRAMLYYDPQKVKAAIVTTGGLAPGLNSVVHSIVKRHVHTYGLNESLDGGVYGVYESFVGLRRLPMDIIPLKPDQTEEWLERGGSELGNRRTRKGDTSAAAFAAELADNLRRSSIDILYVIGGDGSQSVAHEIANANRHMTVVGLPKTMDNDLVWVWQSFGFNSAVEKAAEVINTLHSEAASTRRVAVVELFGADSGFVAANAALASGHADLVLIPEVFKPLEAPECEQMLDQYVQHMKRAVNRDRKRPHGMVIVAEGVGRILLDKGATLAGKPIEKDATGKPKDFTEDLRQYLMGSLFDAAGNSVEVFVNRPQHHIRAGKANAHDQIYCERLGALAVDNALAGYTDFLVSQWLTEFVLVPLPLVVGKRKSIPPEGMFWKQVCSTTRQPAHLARVTVVTSTQP